MAKLLKLRRGSTSDHGNFTGAEGEVTVYITKDTAVVHDGQTVGGRALLREDCNNLPDNAVPATKIGAGALPTDVTVTNANVVSNAAIAGTKISPDFGSQNIATSGTINGVLASTVTATSQSASDNSTKVATTAYVTTALANLVDSSPSALNTLNELAAAINDDANFSTTVTNNIATKLPLAGGQMTGNITFSSTQTVDGRDLSVDGAKLDNIEANATQDQSAAEILTAIKTVDGSGSGLDADTLDGVQASGFVRTNNGAQDINGSLTCDDVIVAGAMLHEGDTNTLVHFTANDEISMKTNGSTRLRAHNSGVDVTGNLVASGNVTAYSDATLKKDIQTINDALSTCGKLRGVSYKWTETDLPSIGVIAQEVEKVLPEVVVDSFGNIDPDTGERPKYKSVDYGKIVGLLINAINELKAEVDVLKGGS